MAFGLQINTSGGQANVLDIRTPKFFGVVAQLVPASAAINTVYYVGYPTGWPSYTDSPSSSLLLSFYVWAYTGTPPDPNPEYNDQIFGVYILDVTTEDTNRRLRLELLAAMPADRYFTGRYYFMAEGS